MSHREKFPVAVFNGVVATTNGLYRISDISIEDARILLQNNEISELASFIFDAKKGVDPYLENLATIWLLHYSLIKTQKASLYSLFFNEIKIKDLLSNLLENKDIFDFDYEKYLLEKINLEKKDFFCDCEIGRAHV